MARFESEQARVIRLAQENKREINAWSATIAQDNATRTIVVFAVTDRAAAGVAATVGKVVRVGRASVRDLPGAIALALASAGAPRGPRAAAPAVRAERPAPAPAERERARAYLQGFGERPSDAAVDAVLGHRTVKRIVGMPCRPITASTGRFVGAPIVGEYTLRGGRAAA